MPQPYRFLITIALSLLLVPAGLLTIEQARGGEFTNLFGMLRGVYALYYIVITVVKASRAFWEQWKNPAAPYPDTGTEFFLAGAAGLLFLSIPNLRSVGGTVDYCVALALAPAGLLGPWLCLLMMKEFAQLKAQAVRGLISLFLLPVAVFVAGLIFHAFSWLPFVAAAAIFLGCVAVARKVPKKILGRAATGILLACLAAVAFYVLSIWPYIASNSAQERGDYKGAIEALRPLAERGSAKAQLYTGFVHGAAMNPKRDEAEALRWYVRAAESGSGFAASMVAQCYLNGWGAKKSETEAAKWYLKSAEMGENGAQDQMGDFYAEGKGGLPKDLKKAIEWYTRSAKQGQSMAYEKLYRIYKSGGEGVKPDYAEAYFWFLALKDFNAKYSMIGACPSTKKRDPKLGMTFREMTSAPEGGCKDEETQNHLTQAEQAAVQKRLEEWKPRPENFWENFLP